jgi:glucosamine-phosphate N-acetyltransferase
MLIRKLLKSDYEEYISLMNEFRPIESNVTKEIFEEMYDIIFKNSIIYVLILDGNIIASAKLIIDHKFIHKLSKYGNIEDVIVKKEHRMGGYGKEIIKHIVDYCKINKFYKIKLSCRKELIPFYEKNNFEVYQIHMSQLL